MRPIIVTAFTSLDGVVEAPGGEPTHRSSGWTFRAVEHDDAVYEIKGREQEQAGGLLLGRVSYESFAPVWGSMPEFERYNSLPRWVVSTTLERDDQRWPATVLRSLDDVARLKEGDGDPILVHGSATLGAALADAGLVDRYHLLVFPILLGAGKRMWSQADKDLEKLRVVESETYANGVLKLVYDVVR